MKIIYCILLLLSLYGCVPEGYRRPGDYYQTTYSYDIHNNGWSSQINPLDWVVYRAVHIFSVTLNTVNGPVNIFSTKKSLEIISEESGGGMNFSYETTSDLVPQTDSPYDYEYNDYCCD